MCVCYMQLTSTRNFPMPDLRHLFRTPNKSSWITFSDGRWRAKLKKNVENLTKDSLVKISDTAAQINFLVTVPDNPRKRNQNYIYCL